MLSPRLLGFGGLGGMVEMRNLFGSMARSTSAPAGYDQIDDTSEGRLKVHAEEAFRAGIKFKARFIGSLEIPKVLVLFFMGCL